MLVDYIAIKRGSNPVVTRHPLDIQNVKRAQKTSKGHQLDISRASRRHPLGKVKQYSCCR